MPIHSKFLDELLGGVSAPVLAAIKAGNVILILQYMHEGVFDPVILSTTVMRDQMRSMGYSAFRSRWAFVRQLLPLQGRLLIEQVLWAMGPPWRTLLTGFNPVELGDVGILIPFEQDRGLTEGELRSKPAARSRASKRQGGQPSVRKRHERHGHHWHGTQHSKRHRRRRGKV